MIMKVEDGEDIPVAPNAGAPESILSGRHQPARRLTTGTVSLPAGKAFDGTADPVRRYSFPENMAPISTIAAAAASPTSIVVAVGPPLERNA
jgi:hypothetical protein